MIELLETEMTPLKIWLRVALLYYRKGDRKSVSCWSNLPGSNLLTVYLIDNTLLLSCSIILLTASDTCSRIFAQFKRLLDMCTDESVVENHYRSDLQGQADVFSSFGSFKLEQVKQLNSEESTIKERKEELIQEATALYEKVRLSVGGGILSCNTEAGRSC